jgi:hypothetical protein
MQCVFRHTLPFLTREQVLIVTALLSGLHIWTIAKTMPSRRTRATDGPALREAAIKISNNSLGKWEIVNGFYLKPMDE